MDELSRTIEEAIERFRRALQITGARRGLSGAEVDEVAQELRLRLWHLLRSGEIPRAIPASYVAKALKSAVVDRLRRRRAHRDGGTLDDLALRAPDRLAAAADDPSRIADERQLEEHVEAALATLAPARRAVVRAWLAGYPQGEIADILGWTEAKVRNLLYRGLTDLRAALRARGVDAQP